MQSPKTKEPPSCGFEKLAGQIELVSLHLRGLLWSAVILPQIELSSGGAMFVHTKLRSKEDEALKY
jgi:hypothetical protein